MANATTQMKVKKRKTVDTWKKKDWKVIVAPKFFEEKEVGTTVSAGDDALMNRVLNIPLREITGNMNHQFIKIILRINEIKGETAHTVLEGFELSEEYLRRNIRRRRSIIKLIQNGITKDGKHVRLTAHLFTARKIDTSKKMALRKVMEDYFTKEIPENTIESLVQNSVFGKFSSDIFKQAKVISPTKRVEISKCKLVKEKSE